MKSKNRHARVGIKIIEELNEIKVDRRRGVDKSYSKDVSTERLLNKAIEYPEWKPIRERLKKEPRIEEVDGSFRKFGGSVL